MFIFLLSAFPLFIYFLLHIERERSTWVDFITFKDHGLPFIRGILTFLPAVLLLFLFQNIFIETFNPLGLYFYYLFKDHFIYAAVVTGFFILFVHIFNGDDSYISYSIFAGGFFTVVSVMAVVQYYNQFDSYELFLLPLLRLEFIFITSCVVTRIFSSDGIIRVLFIFILIAVPALLGVVTYLYKSNYIFISFASGVILFIISFFIMARLKE